VGLLRFLRAHLDLAVACLLAAAFVAEVALAGTSVVGEPLLSVLDGDESVALGADVLFLFSLALRSRLPLVPLSLAYGALVLTGQGRIEAWAVLAAGLMIATYSVGAWAGGRSGLLGAAGVGGLAGLGVLRAMDGVLLPREAALPIVLVVGPWLAGLTMRSLRAARGDERVAGDLDWAAAGGLDAIGRDDTVRQIRDTVERSMSTVILQARAARASLTREPDRSQRALAVIEAAGTEALEETQRLTGLLLTPDGTPLPGPQAGLADVDYLAAQVTDAGLPVATRVEGKPLPLSPDLDGVAYRVVHEALMSSLHHSTDAHASVVIRFGRDELQIEVSDDGISLEDDDAVEETAGLMAVRDEVAGLGGTLDAGPGDGRGYWVLASLPYEPDDR
jgi:signal transduction histidine kinase